VTDLLKDGLHESLSELHNHVLVSKGHFQIHLGETGLSVTSCVLHHTCTVVLSEALSVLCQCSLTVSVVMLACRSVSQNTRMLLNCLGVKSYCSFAFTLLPHQQYYHHHRHHHHFIGTCTLVRLQGLLKYVESIKGKACMQYTKRCQAHSRTPVDTLLKLQEHAGIMV